MSQPQKTETVEVVAVSEKQAAAILKSCEEKIEGALARIKRGEQLNNFDRLIIGNQIRIAKPHVPLAARGVNGHGSENGDGVENWLKTRFGLEKQTAHNYLRFSEAFLLAVESKSKTVGRLAKLLPEFSGGEIDGPTGNEEAVTLFTTIVGDDGMMDFIDKHAPRKKGGLLPIKFHCPCCADKGERTLLKQIAGRNIKCPKCGHTVKAKPDVKETSDEDRQAADARLAEITGDIEHIISNAEGKNAAQSERGRCSDEAWRTFVAACQRVSAFDAKYKNRKPKTSKK